MKSKAVKDAIAASLSVIAIVAATAAFADEDEAATRVRAKMKEMYPANRVDAINPTPISGLFEVVMGQNVVYVEPSGRYFFFGRLFDMQARKDLTQARLQEVERIDVVALPLSDAIKAVHGGGRRTLYVFADPNCPHCRALEKTLAAVDNVTVYTFLYPVLSEDSTAKARAIWCAGDRLAAWNEWNAHGVAPPQHACADPIERNLSLGKSLNVSGTPTMFSSDGRRLSGALPAQEIVSFLDRTSALATASEPTPKTPAPRR